MPTKLPTSLDKGNPGGQEEPPPPVPSPSGSRLPFPRPGGKLPVPPPGGRLPAPPPGGKSSGTAGAGLPVRPPQRGGWGLRGLDRGGPRPRGGLPPPPPPGAPPGLPPGYEDAGPRGGILLGPRRPRGGAYGPRGRGMMYAGRMFGLRGRGGFGQPGAGPSDSELFDDASSKIPNDAIFAFLVVFLHGNDLHVASSITMVPNLSIARMTAIVAFPVFLMARVSSSLWRRRWISPYVDAIFSAVAGVDYLAVCFFDFLNMPLGGNLIHLPPQHTKLNQVAISFKLFFSAMLAGLLIFDGFIYFTRAKNAKIYLTF